MKTVKNIILGLICLNMYCFGTTIEKKQNLNIIFIGNSITAGAQIKDPAQDAPPVKASEYLRQQSGIGLVQFSNQGVSGCTTLDYLPATAALFPRAVEAADKFKGDKNSQLVFSIMLGTNDSAIKGPHGAPVSPKQYRTNLKVIIDNLLLLYPECKIVLHRPIWYSPNTYNGAMYLLEGLKRLESYWPELQSLVSDYANNSPRRVYIGDIEAFEYFKQAYQTDLTPEEGNAGTFYLHPNKKGAQKLGIFWAKGILKAL